MAPEFKSRGTSFDEGAWQTAFYLVEEALIAEFKAGMRWVEAHRAKNWKAAERALIDVLKARTRARRAMDLLMLSSETEGRA